jgi:hypothetical protein
VSWKNIFSSKNLNYLSNNATVIWTFNYRTKPTPAPVRRSNSTPHIRTVNIWSWPAVMYIPANSWVICYYPGQNKKWEKLI